jgi:hypothetical protein
VKSISILDTLDDSRLFGCFLRKPETWGGMAEAELHRPQHIAAEPPANVGPTVHSASRKA